MLPFPPTQDLMGNDEFIRDVLRIVVSDVKLPRRIFSDIEDMTAEVTARLREQAKMK